MHPEKPKRVFFMEALKEFTVPLTGLKPGNHSFNYVVGAMFFSHFENSPIQDGSFEVMIILDRRSNHAYLEFEIKGSYKCYCDRCLVVIDLPIESKSQLILKFEEGEDSDEIIYLDAKVFEWNAAKIIFELICLAKPLTNVYDCKGKPCDQVMLKKLNGLEVGEKTADKLSSIWENLKNIKLN